MVRYSLFNIILLALLFASVTGQYENCTGELHWIGDGFCDIENNYADCGYDGGDCCECSCTNDRLYPCGIWGFSCSDPYTLDNGDSCQNQGSSVGTCSSDIPQSWVVNDTASALSLAEAVNCSSGTFNVTWLGSVLVNRTFYIPDGTSLYMVGAGSGAELNGGGEIRLFMAEGAELHIDGLILSNGIASYGGAIAATRSNVVLNQTSCSGNIALTYGGAIYVGMGSTFVWEGQTLLTGNHAFEGGGAVVVSTNSSCSWLGWTEFSSNFANYGGAVFVSKQSRILWDGVTSFVSNAAQYGGAFFASVDSFVSSKGETSFANNTAQYGGAFYVEADSIVSWNWETSFANNTAQYGGAFFANVNSFVSSKGVTSFASNTAQYGGAIVVYVNSIVLWDGVTSFIDNNAEDLGGALLAYENSNVSWNGVTSFLNNTAQNEGRGGGLATSSDNLSGTYGGAFYVYRSSNVSWHGVTTFVDNTARYGGAFFVELGSIALWDGVTYFVNNSADEGGAFCASNSTVLWGGVTSFVDNMAHLHGGAFCAYHSSIVSWNGVTSFVENAAHLYGGALYAFGDSVVSWNGETAFVNNAAQNGGAFYVYNSIISWDEETTFVNNVAHQGGAFYVYFSFVSWAGETSFIANNASSSGGAVYVASSSYITMGGDTYFIENKAGEDGGAAYVYVDHGYDNLSYITVDNNSTVLFRGNTCGGNGGATAFIGEVITRFAPNMTFMGNNAGIAGGAVYMLGSINGMTFEGTRFISNSAVIGGGLYSTGNGIAVTEDAEGNLEYYPTTLMECEFVENKAMKTGGAMDSSAGRDMIVNTSFVGNIASLGGALRLVGTASLIGCNFFENLSGENDGPGISNDGVILFISNCSFNDNAFNCRTGFFLDFDEMDTLFETVCKGCDIQCSGCTFKGKEPICLGELGHSTSAGGNTTLESLLVERGYWRATNTSMEILACYNAEACLGGLTGGKGYCSKGYKGPYCSVCSKGYTASLGFACNKCSNNATGGIALAVVMTVVILLFFAAFLSYVLSGEMEDADRGIVVRVTRFVPLQTVKIVIVVWQIVTQFSAVANVVFPSVYQKFLDGLDILNFDISWVFSTKCIIETDFHDQLLLATLGPLVCMVILGSTYVVAMHQNRASERARGIVRRKHVSMLLLLTFLVYSPASSTLFKTFACEELDDGRIYLRADYRIVCDSFKHNVLEIYAVFMGVLYVLGIPAFYGILLSSNREALIKNVGREGDERIKPITHLWKPYRPDRFYYEVIECLRRVSLTGALVFIYPNTAAQIAVALMMAVFFIIVSEALAPYESPWDTWCSRTGHAIIYTSMFLALLLKVDVSGERASSQRVFESVLIAAHSCLILIVVVEAVALIVAWSKEVKEHTEPQIHPGVSGASSRVFRDGAVLEDSDEVLPPFQDEGFKG